MGPVSSSSYLSKNIKIPDDGFSFIYFACIISSNILIEKAVVMKERTPFTMIEKAREYAYWKHNRPSESQRYGSAPYSLHLENVVDVIKKYKYLLDEECHEDVIAAGYLHDSVEDTDTTPEMLKAMFNLRIAELVLRVSNERGWDKKEILFKTLPKIWQNKLATFLKLCDRIANGQTSKQGDSEKSKTVYHRYLMEYPIFRYALKTTGEYDEMWKELDLIFNFE
ncbi:hypothetical protein SDC9_69711 [bioreactor metagenome]|uniref:HD/PDEase domain-containing protein n=1 Tax=bioreactor metagenome TaxID=1076179 RepID=A0A644Y3Z0_9ZZZZ